MRPRAGTRSRPRAGWNLLDSDILAWQAERMPDARFLVDLCEVRLAIEPTASAFAAVRATDAELDEIGLCLEERETLPQGASLEAVVDLDLEFVNDVIAASHNPLLTNLASIIRIPFRTTLLYTFRSQVTVALALKSHRDLLRALRRHNPIAASKAAERAVGVAMVAAGEKLKVQSKPQLAGKRLARQ